MRPPSADRSRRAYASAATAREPRSPARHRDGRRGGDAWRELEAPRAGAQAIAVVARAAGRRCLRPPGGAPAELRTAAAAPRVPAWVPAPRAAARARQAGFLAG